MAQSGSCQICGLRNSKYHCPKCELAYCSVECYQSESHLQCSEQFYEQWVHEELKDCQIDPEAKKRMLEILMQQQQETNLEDSLDSDDEDSIPDLSSRLMDVNLDDEEAVWEKLSPEERQEFRKLVATGNIMKILPEWEPWWKTKKRKTLIQDSDEDFDWKSLCPEISSDVPELSKLTTRTPSPEVAFMLLNVLLSYIFTVRWFKGTHKELPLEGMSTCIALSATLRDNKVFKNPVEAFAAFDEDVFKCEWVKGEESHKDAIQEDLEDIIRGSHEGDLFFCTKAAISDLKSLCQLALGILKENNTNHLKKFSGPPPKASLLQQISKKMTYYLSWIVDHGSSLNNILSGFTPNTSGILMVQH